MRSNRNFSRRVSEERIAEFHRFALDFNSLLDEMEEWQLRLQAKNAQLLRTALHDPLTGLANRAAFRSGINTLMNSSDARKTSALLFLDGDNFKYINDTWGHATGDRVLIEIAKRLAEFGGLQHKAYRLGGDEFAMVLYDVQSESEVQQICSALTQIFNRPFDLHNGHQTTMTLSIGYAMTIAHASAEKLQELADHNMYQAKHQQSRKAGEITRIYRYDKAPGSTLIFTSLVLTGCQSPQGKFTPEQVVAMQSYGFTESAGDWSLGLSDAILFAKMTTNCSRKASNRSKPWQPNWPRQG